MSMGRRGFLSLKALAISIAVAVGIVAMSYVIVTQFSAYSVKESIGTTTTSEPISNSEDSPETQNGNEADTGSTTSSTNPTTTSTSPNPSGGPVGGQSEDATTTTTAIESEHIDGDCENAEYPDSCYYDMALNETDHTYCNGIVDAETRDDCLDEIAFEKKDISVCSHIENLETRDYCYSDIAFYNENFDECDPISDDYTRDDCYYFILINIDTEDSSTDSSICDRFVTEYKQDCLDEFETI